MNDRIAILSLLVFSSILAGILISPLLGASILFLAPLFIILLGHPRLLGIAVFVWTALTASMLNYWLPIGMVKTAASYGGFAALVALLLMNLLLSRNQIFSNALERRMYGLFFIVLIASYLFGRKDLFPLAMFVKNYLMYIVAYLFALRFFHNKTDSRKFVRFLFVLLFIQLFLNITWLAGINPLPTRPLWNDVGIGTLGNQESVAYFSIMMMVVGYASFVCSKDNGSSVKAIGIISVSVVVLLSTYTAHALIMGAGVLGLAILVWMPLSQKAKNGLVLALVGGTAVVLIGFLPIFSDVGENLYETLYITPERIEMPIERFLLSDKVKSYEFSFVDIPQNRPFSLVFGTGPGTYMSASALNYPTPLTYQYIGQFYLTVTGQALQQGGSVSSQPITGICALWTEMGTIAFSCYLFFFIYPSVRSFKLAKNGLITDRYQRVLALSLPFAVLVFMIQNFLWDHFCVDFFMILLGYWAGIARRIHPSDAGAEEAAVS